MSNVPLVPPTPDRDATLPRVLVLDFDGTVCLGDGVVWAYADAALRLVPSEVEPRLRRELVAFLSGETEHEWADGYSAVAALVSPLVSPDALSAAYLQSRTALSDPGVKISSPVGLAALLDDIAPTVRRLVVTNAPATGLDVALHRLGLAEHVDGFVDSAGKPDHSAELLRRLLDSRAPAELMSVGDFWFNDIGPALELGCATAFVDHTGRDRGPAHVRGTSFEALYPAIREWATCPQSFITNHPALLEPVPTDT